MAVMAVAVDLARVRRAPTGRSEVIHYLYLGDQVEVVRITDALLEVQVRLSVEQNDGSLKPEIVTGYIVPAKAGGIEPRDVVCEPAESRVLRVDFVDVQQGDGALIVGPGGQTMTIDGGDNQLFARYLASQFPDTTLQAPKVIDCMLVTHGDADHFLGLTEIPRSEKHELAWKRIFIKPTRVFHNGLVKRTSEVDGKRRPETEMLGAAVERDGAWFITGLHEDLRAVPDAEMNTPFRAWKRVLAGYTNRYPDALTEVRRLGAGDDDAFAFLEDVDVEVLAPLTDPIDGAPALRFLGEPADRRDGQPIRFRGESASHTINGHSVVLRMTFGNFRFLFCGDLNAQAEERLRQHPEALKAEVLKTPHHGSADFSVAFIKAVSPVISVVSSGDESEQKEFIHPRANLLGALGRHSRLDEPLIFVTELAAFFQVRGYVGEEWHQMKAGAEVKSQVVDLNLPHNKRFFAFSRAAFGIVRVRTDGRRLVVCTDSASTTLREAYAFEADSIGDAVPVGTRVA